MPKYIPWPDATRILAIFGVILIHATAKLFSDRRSDFYKIQIANAFDSFPRISVPLFAIISGALLLKSETSLENVKNIILRVALPLIFWSLIYEFCVNYWSPFPFEFFKSMISIFQSSIMYHLWFIANSLTIYFPFNLIQLMSIAGFISWSGYFILGYYLSNTKQFSNISQSNLLFIFLLSSFFTFGLTRHLNTNFCPLIEIAYNDFSPKVVIASAVAFLWLKQVTISNFYAKNIIVRAKADILDEIHALLHQTYNHAKEKAMTDLKESTL